MEKGTTFSAFAGDRLLASGALELILARVKASFDSQEPEAVLIFEDQSGRQVDFDLRGSIDEVLARATRPEPEPPRAGPGRPKLGVVSREISLLPRHWEWLEQQPNGISAALRRLVDEAKKRAPEEEQARLVREAAYRFMTAMGGNLPGYEEAARALFAKQNEVVEELIETWPQDIRTHLVRMLRAES
jgi:hypothetical protein